MDDNGNREIGRHKPDQYRSVQWMMPQHQVKDHNAAQTVKFMSIIAERDNAIYERDLALSEKKTAQAERDMAIFQRDAAINDRNNAIIERDNAIEALEYARDNTTTTSNINGNSNSPYDHRSEVFQTSSTPGPVKSVQQGKKPRIKSESVPSKKGPNKSGKKNKRSDDGMSGEWRDDGVKSQSQKKHRKEWKVEDLGGLNEVVFDESTMPVPVCSCTGRYQPCYKWGNGGWQSACCTTTISMYPLPMMPNKRHARVNGRKMSGTVFSKLLSKMAAEGHDLSVALDLKDHWSKHGTNRYITIK